GMLFHRTDDERLQYFTFYQVKVIAILFLKCLIYLLSERIQVIRLGIKFNKPLMVWQLASRRIHLGSNGELTDADPISVSHRQQRTFHFLANDVFPKS